MKKESIKKDAWPYGHAVLFFVAQKKGSIYNRPLLLTSIGGNKGTLFTSHGTLLFDSFSDFLQACSSMDYTAGVKEKAQDAVQH